MRIGGRRDAAGLRPELHEAGRIAVVALKLDSDRAEVDDQGDGQRPE